MASACAVVIAAAALLLLAVAADTHLDSDADAYEMTPGSGRTLQTRTTRPPRAAAGRVRDPVQWLVQFSSIVTDATLRAFANSVSCESGGPVHGDDAGGLVCVGDGDVLDHALQFPGVLRVVERPASARVAPYTPDLGHYYVRCLGDDCAPVTRELTRNRIVWRRARTKLWVWPHQSSLRVLRSSPYVLWIEHKSQWKLHNAGGRDVLTQGIISTSYNRSASRTTQFLRGEGQLISVCDSGIDMNNCFFSQPGGAPVNTVDFNRPKIVANLVANCTTCGGDQGCSGLCADGVDVSGHGTHVAGSVAGRAPGPPQNLNDGIAPDAKLLIQDIETSQGYLNPGDHMADLFTPAYNLGARIHTNSWGCQVPEGGPANACNVYKTSDQEIDDFTHSNPDFLVLVAAGNDGREAPSGTVGSPAICKNCLVVGASVLDPAQNIEAAQFMNPYDEICFWDPQTPCCQTPHGCTLADCCVTFASCCPEVYHAYKTSQLAKFSSTGPTRDGRFKPELVCPGENIASAYFSPQATSTFCTPGGDHGLPVNATSWGNRATTVKSGTSFSTPLMAGAAALVREYFYKGFYPTGRPVDANRLNATSALIRAMLIASASQVTAIHSDSGLKSISEWSGDQSPYGGFGVPSLDRVLYFADSPAPTRAMVINGVVDQATQEHVYSVQISPGTSIPTSVVLVWTDPEGNIGSSKQLVNDLDLIVVLPGNHHLYGNGRLFADTANTVEKIVISPDGNTTITVVVRAGMLRSASQAFSLVANGAIVSFGPLQTYEFDLKTGRVEHQNTDSELVTDNSQCFSGGEKQIFSDGKMRLRCVPLPLIDSHIPSSLLEWRIHLAQVMHLPLSSVQYNTTTKQLCVGCNLYIATETHLRYQSPEQVLDNVIKSSSIPQTLLRVDPVLNRANWSALDANLQPLATTAPPPPPPPPPPQYQGVSSGSDRARFSGLLCIILSGFVFTIMLRGAGSVAEGDNDEEAG